MKLRSCSVVDSLSCYVVGVLICGVVVMWRHDVVYLYMCVEL